VWRRFIFLGSIGRDIRETTSRAGIGVLEQMETPIAERDDGLVSIES
jgi:hypothetical protein